MRIAVGADHAGFALKTAIAGALRGQGHQVLDCGASGPDSVDYPDYALPVASAVSRGEADRGILVCFTGIGMSIAANKVPGIRAAVAFNADAVRLTRAHNDANVLALGARYTDPAAALEYISAFLDTPFEAGRHARRVGKIAAIESGSSAGEDACRSAS